MAKKKKINRKKDLTDIFNKDIKVRGNQSKELTELLDEGFIEKGSDDKGDFFVIKK